MKNQLGFRPGKSTTGAIDEATKFIYNGLDKHNKVLAVFLNLAKAFDTVDHNKLINILPGIGIKNESLDWFKSYLSNKKQVVFLNDILSKEK